MDTEILAGILGMFVPFVVGIIVRAKTSSKVKGLLALALSVTVGAVTAVASGEVTLTLQGDLLAQMMQVVEYAGIVLISAQAAYNMWIEPTGLATWVQKNLGNT